MNSLTANNRLSQQLVVSVAEHLLLRHECRLPNHLAVSNHRELYLTVGGELCGNLTAGFVTEEGFMSMLFVGNPLRKLVLIKLADNASDQGECWPSYQHIADQCEISKRSVMNHIAALCESGLVKKVTRKGEKGNSSNIYLLHLDGAGDSLGGSANNSLSGAANSPGSAGVAPGGSAGDSPRTSHSFEPVKESVNEPIAVGASADESVRVRSNRPEYSPEFEQAWLAYPKRAGGNSKSAAFKAWKARLNEGVNPETMLEGVKRYAGWVSAMGNSGTQFVKQAVTFFGPDRHFEESWEVPAVSAARREDPYFKASYDNVDYSQIPAGFRG